MSISYLRNRIIITDSLTVAADGAGCWCHMYRSENSSQAIVVDVLLQSYDCIGFCTDKMIDYNLRRKS